MAAPGPAPASGPAPGPAPADGDTGARRPRARRGQGELLRDEILDAAEQLLGETGDADKVSVRMVADRVGRTSPSIYLHFADKATLMMAVCERQFAGYDQTVRDALVGVDDPIEVFRALGRTYVRFAREHPEEFRILFMSDRSATGGFSTLEEMAGTSSFEAALRMLQAGIDDGRFRPDVDLMMVTVTMWALLQGIASLLVTRPVMDFPDADEWVDFAIALQLDGLLAR